MDDALTSNFTHVDSISVGPAHVFDADGVSEGVAIIVVGEDNESGETKVATAVLPIEMAVEFNEQLGVLLQQAATT